MTITELQKALQEMYEKYGDIEDSNDTKNSGTSVLPILKEAMRNIAHYKEVFNPRQLELFDL